MKELLFVGLGGIIGSSLRYAFSFVVSGWSLFPFDTLFVNATGSFLLAFLLFSSSLRQKMGSYLFTALSTGVLGSYTTFSTLALELVQIIEKQPIIAISYASLTLISGLGFAFLGYTAAKRQEHV